MKKSKKKVFNLHLANILISFVLVICALSQAQPALAQADKPESIIGVFTTIIIDSETGESTEIYMLTDAHGQTTRLLIDETLINSLGGLSAVNLQQVEIQGGGQISNDKKPTNGMAELQVKTIQLTRQKTTVGTSNVSKAVTGSQPWITILCKFSDYPDEPNTLSSYKNMYANTFPGLDHYWREVSYGTINLAGSNAVGWYALPQPHAYYVNNGGINLITSRDDCIHKADANVDFSRFAGINLVFNASVGAGGISLLGAGYSATLDGVSKAWMINWLPDEPSGYLPTIAHEIGHGFGLNHSSGKTGATYDNEWDVMSQNWCWRPGSVNPTYGCLPQHTLAYNKNFLGWILPSQKYTAVNGEATITLEQLALPQTNHYKIAIIPIGKSSTHFYTLEARRRTGYDARLPGAAVIIHEIRDDGYAPYAYVIDQDGNGDTGDAGGMWTVGESFSDPVYGITVTVNSATSTGFTVSIHIENPAPTDITLSNADVLEWLPSGTPVGTFASAADVEDTHTYSFCGGADDSSFQLSANQLKTAQIFDFEAKSSFNICIRTTDSVGQTFDKTFIITVHEAQLTVDTLQDYTDQSCSDGSCTLRDAIRTIPENGVINFSVNGTINLTSNIVLNKNLTINGPGAGNLTISGNQALPVFVISEGMTIFANGLTISKGVQHWNGTSGGAGGGIYNDGTLILTNSVVTGNRSQWGGGIYNGGTLTVSNTVFANNLAYKFPNLNSSGTGGAIYNAGTLTLTNSTFSGNKAQADGGGIYNDGMLTVVNSILWGNIAGETGLQIYSAPYNTSPITVSYSDIQGGYAGTAILNTNPLFIRNPAQGADGLWATSDDDYGDLHLQQPASPAIHAGTNNAVSATSDLDGNPRIVGNVVDLGPYEAQVSPALGMIYGKATHAGLGIAAIDVALYSQSGGNWTQTNSMQTSASGLYFFDSVADGDYRVGFSDSSQLFLPIYFGGQAIDAAQTISILNQSHFVANVELSTLGPTAITNLASFGFNGIKLKGTINPKGVNTTVTFEYGLTTSYGTSIPAEQSPIAGGTYAPVSKTITGLIPNMLYHYRVKAVNSLGTTYGGDLTFITDASSAKIILIDNGIAENEPIGTVVGLLLATPRIANAYTFVLQSGPGCNGQNNNLFEISGNQLKTKAILDFETKNNYNICIRAQNGTNRAFNNAFVTYIQNVSENILKNNGFNLYPTTTSMIPTNWAQTNFAANDGKHLIVTNIKEGVASIKITNTTAITKTLTQGFLAQTGLKSDPFILSYWVKGSAVPVTAGVCQARVLFYSGAALVGTQTLPCGSTGTFAYQYKSLSFGAPANYTKIAIQFTYSKASGTVWFDFVSLRK